MAKNNGLYVIPSGIDKSVSDVIKTQLKNVDLKQSTLRDENIDLSIRSSKTYWVETDHWISGMMSHFINCANVDYFKYDLHNWADKIQYTVYDGPGTGYKWHNDYAPSSKYEGMYRKLSISICLDDEYEGGELQLLSTSNELHTMKMKCGDVVIFSSDIVHRVRPLKSGYRSSLVGWYGGPKFK